MIAISTSLLLLPIARSGPGAADFLTALFTAVSAVCVTGLIVVDTATYWTPFGQAVILASVQVGGFGIMAGATLMGLLVSRRLGLRTRLLAQAETKALALGDVASILRLAFAITLLVEGLLWTILTMRFHFAYGEAWPAAIWSGLFHSVSAFNNAGFSSYTPGMVLFAEDELVLVPIMLAVVIGGIGFPVLADLRRNLTAPARWTVHTKVTLLGYLLLFAIGLLAVLLYEWSNPATFGRLEPWGRFWNAAFHSVMTRSGGFNAVDTGQMRSESLAVSNALMFIGGGSAGTGGGIKVTTFFILGFVVWAEIRGEPDTVTFRRRITREVQRQALTVALLAVTTIGLGTLFLLSVSECALEPVLFEAISAFATVGLSTGITDDLPAAGQLALVVLMFMGRVGTITVATGLALRDLRRPYRYPEERPIVG